MILSRKNVLKIVPWSAALLLWLGLAPASAATGATSLRISRDARADPLGPGFVSLADNVSAMHLNPAGLSKIARPELSGFYSSYLLDSRITALDFAYPGSRFGNFGFGYFSLGVNSIQGRDANGNQTGSFSAEDRVLNVSLGRDVVVPFASEFLPGKSSLGASFKLFQSKLGAASANAVAVDVGAQHRLEGLPVSLGASLRNLGPGLNYGGGSESLPLNMALGASYFAKPLASNLFVGLSHGLNDQKTDFSVGLEAMLGSMFSLRGGTFMSANGARGSDSTSQPFGVSGGFGLAFSNYKIDTAITPMGDLGMTYKFNFTYKFGGGPAFKWDRLRDAVSGGNKQLGNTKINRNVDSGAKEDDNGNVMYLIR